MGQTFSVLRESQIAFIAVLLHFAAPPPPASPQLPVIASAALPQASPNPSAPCPITHPPVPPFLPPVPYDAIPDPHSFWFGTEKLWTILHTDGTWNGLPHYTPDDPTFRQKLFFWRVGFNARSEPRPDLTITGKRLDGPAPPLASDQANAGWQNTDQPFMVTGINIPTLGCWQITAHYRSKALTFVVRVTQ